MKSKKTVVIIVMVLYLLIVLIFKPGFYLTNCNCGWQFELIRSNMDCKKYCYEYDEITTGQKIVNVLLLNFRE